MIPGLNPPLSAKCIIYLMFSFNFLFAITGLIMFIVGITIQGYYYNYEHFLDDSFFSLPVFMIIVGSIIFIIAFFGCYGSIRENYYMILIFVGLLIVVFIFELSSGIAGYVLRGKVEEVATKKMLDSMTNYGENKSKIISGLWDTIEEEWKCCGVTNASDWTEKNLPLPVKCCEVPSGKTTNFTCDIDHVYKNGCLSELAKYLKSHASSLGAAGICIAVVQVIGIWFAIYLARIIKASYEVV